MYDEGDFDYYFFDKNIFGDIVGIYNENGRKICTYTYDAWGVCETTLSSGISSIERAVADQYNPFRYRGYFYDVETGYYYLQTRYYNPEWGRFLNADGYINANGDILGYNMFAYCSNNPISFNDPTGEGKVWDWLKEKVVDPAAEFIIDTIFESLDTAYPGNPINVLSIGVNVSGGCGLGVSLSFGVSIDREGSINPTVSVAAGGFAGCGASINFSYSVSTATKNDTLNGLGGNFGGSFAVPVYGPIGVGGGVDVSVGYDKYTNGPYFSVTFSEGVSVGPSPIEFHGQVNYTWVLPGFKVGE